MISHNFCGSRIQLGQVEWLALLCYAWHIQLEDLKAEAEVILVLFAHLSGG